MKTIEKAEIKKLSFPVNGYNYNVQVLRSVDGGETFVYCGSGKYFKTYEKAEAYSKLFK